MSLAPLLLTLQLIAVSVAIAAAIGIVSAWASSVLHSGVIARTFASCFLLALVTAIAMPLVLQAAAWEATAGKFGWWTMTQTGVRTDSAGVYGSFQGLVACGWIHGLHGAAIVALATWYGTQATPRSVIEQSRLDMGPVASWWKVQLPIASPWIVAALLATTAIASTEMSVVDLYGYRTIADTFYLYNTIDASLALVLWTCALPLAIAVALLMWLSVSRRRLLATQTDLEPSTAPETSSQPVAMAGIAVVVVAATTIALVPISGLLIKSGHQVTIEAGAVRGFWSPAASWEHVIAAPRLFAAEYSWTALIGTTSGLCAMLIAWPLAMIGRTHRGVERVADICTVLTFAIPGPVIGMAMVNLFQQPIPGFRFLYAQTIGPTVMALMIRAVPVAYWVLRAGYRGIGDAVIDTARLDFSAIGRWWKVDRPLLGRHLVLACLASSLFASGDVATMLPIIPAGVTTVGTRLFELLHSGARYQEASLAIWYVLAVVVVAIVFSQVQGRKAAS